MRFKKQEVTAIFKMAFKMAAADGKFMDEEKAAIAFGMREFGMSPSEMVEYTTSTADMNNVQALAILSSLDNNKKKYATGLLAAIIASDGDIDDSEVNMWQLICTLANFPTMNFGEAIVFWKNCVDKGFIIIEP